MKEHHEDGADRLRILFMTADRFPPFRPAAKAIFAEELPRRGHSVDWLIQGDSPAAGAGARAFSGGTAYVAYNNGGVSRSRRALRHWQSFKNDLKIVALLRRERYSLIQVKDKYLGALIAIVAGRLFGVPVLHWLAYPHAEHDLYAAAQGFARYPLLYVVRARLQKWILYRIIMRSARHVFVQSEQMRCDVAREGVPSSKMTPVPSSVNLADLAADGPAPPLPKPSDERWLVYLGTLTREREVELLVRALRKVVDEFPNARLLLVGCGHMPGDETLLESEARRLGVVERLSITGWRPMREAWSYVRAADVCLSPYPPVPILRSTSPTKLIEYLAFAKPVVANDHPEQSLVIEQSGGGVICEWSEDGFARGILHLLRDPGAATRMGAAGKRFVEQHRTHTKMTDVVEQVYRRLTAGPATEMAAITPERVRD
jgi:glycosyltransferase involved in cell wall biosynthesis